VYTQIWILEAVTFHGENPLKNKISVRNTNQYKFVSDLSYEKLKRERRFQLCSNSERNRERVRENYRLEVEAKN